VNCPDHARCQTGTNCRHLLNNQSYRYEVQTPSPIFLWYIGCQHVYTGQGFNQPPVKILLIPLVHFQDQGLDLFLQHIPDQRDQFHLFFAHLERYHDDSPSRLALSHLI
jgi:hypothetical protein